MVHVREHVQGISGDELRTIFEPFERETPREARDSPRDRQGAGRGQGGSIHVNPREAVISGSRCLNW